MNVQSHHPEKRKQGDYKLGLGCLTTVTSLVSSQRHGCYYRNALWMGQKLQGDRKRASEGWMKLRLRNPLRQLKMWNYIATFTPKYQSLPITNNPPNNSGSWSGFFFSGGEGASIWWVCSTPEGRPLLAFAYLKVIKEQYKLGQLPQQQQLTFSNLAGIGIFYESKSH